ncbi:MAG: hypothetical protein NC191_02450 [Muribaculaceae bacterium]|nr:hypothetical protein [Muribaculaceae bacterium]
MSEDKKLQTKLEELKKIQHDKDLQIEDAIYLIYTYLNFSDLFIEKYSIANPELLNLGLMLNNIRDIIMKLDKNYNILKDKDLALDKAEKEVAQKQMEECIKQLF